MLCESPIEIKNDKFASVPDWIEYIRVPCGKCFFCRLEKAKEWGLRCALEWFVNGDKKCYFITLTYNDFFNDGNLHKEHVKYFIKKLRSKFRDVKFKYFCCGEFGENTSRPHYHLLLFGLDIGNLSFYKMSGKNALFSSDILNNIWKYGFCVIGNLSFSTAFYTARYAMKKNVVGGMIQLQSQGIGKDYFLRNWNNIIANCCVFFNNIKFKIPRYFLFNVYRKMVSESEYNSYIKANFLKNRDYVLDLAKVYSCKDTLMKFHAFKFGRSTLSVQDWKEFGDKLAKKVSYERSQRLRDNF